MVEGGRGREGWHSPPRSSAFTQSPCQPLRGANSWSPDGRTIVFQRDRNGDGGSDHIYVINADGNGERNLTRGRGPVWSPDGQKISFTSKRENWAEIYVMNADGSGQQRLTHSSAGTFNDSLVWSPSWGTA